MATKATKPRINRRDLTLVNLRAYKHDLKLIGNALRSIDKRLHLVESNLAALMVPKVEPTDTGVRITLAESGGGT